MTDSLPKERLDELDALADLATPVAWSAQGFEYREYEVQG